MADTVVILGQGSMGLECLQIARISGAGRIITVDVRAEACELSRELGADYALNAKECDVVATIHSPQAAMGPSWPGKLGEFIWSGPDPAIRDS